MNYYRNLSIKYQMKTTSQILSTFKESIFTTLTNLARENEAINLSQGFPDFDGPDWVIENAKKALEEGQKNINQYAPMPGILSLRTIISEISNKHYGLDFDPHQEVTITNGATEAIFCTIQAVLNPGDEVLVFEPYYDSYIASIKLAGGIPKIVTLHAPDFKFDEKELEQAFSHKTKLVILNTPHNPTGKVFSQEELGKIKDLCLKFDTYCLSDEVYEHLTFDDYKHIPIASLEGMRERTITISSVGKTFGITGWKVGWTLASPELSHAIRMIHQFNTFCVCHPLQKAVYESLKNIDQYLIEFKKDYSRKKDLFFNGLKELGFNPQDPQGTYFIMAPISHLTNLSDIDFSMELIKNKKVATIPPSAFYTHSKDGEKYLRFCFAKKDETLKQALENLKN